MSDSIDDIEAIRTLKARYFRLLDTKDWAGWRELFTDDLVAETDVTPPKPDGSHKLPPVHGADIFVEQVRTTLGDGVTVHHGHMPEIELLSETSAHGIWAMEDIVAFPTMLLRGYGHYHEHYRKQQDDWRIARLHLTRLRVDITPSG